MRFRQFVSSFLIVALAVTGMTIPTSAAVDRATVNYLQNQDQSNAWVLMALRAGGQTPSASRLPSTLNTVTDIERTILAVTASNQDPTNFNGINLIQKLDAERRNRQIGSTTLINDDIFGVLAYISAGIPYSDLRISESKEYILQYQNSDGGWSHATSSPSDSNMTAMAISALIRAGVSQNDPVITRGVNYIKTTQNTDGGFGISPNSDSDSASTAWVISALQIAGKTPASFTKGTSTPFTFLNTVKHTDASYKWKTNEGRGNATMTAYVAIALAGTGYPVTVRRGSTTSTNTTVSRTNTTNTNTVANNTTTTNTNTVRVGSPTRGTVQVNFRIEGRQNQVCAGTAVAPNPLELVKSAASQCGYSYFIDQTSFGSYLQRLNADQASGTNGWLYLVNWKQPSVAADQYQLQNGDYVTWFFGEFDWKPLRAQLINRSTAQQQGNPIIEVQQLQSNNIWRPLSGATVYLSGRTATTNSGGQASFNVSSGSYEFYADKNEYIRSARETFTVNSSSNNTTNTTNSNTRISRSIPLETNVITDRVFVQNTNTVNTNPTAPQMSFSVSITNGGGSLGFGTLREGQTSTKSVTLTNTGSRSLLMTATVTGDSLYTNNLRLNNQTWGNFSQRINVNSASRVDVSLTVPVNYSDGFKRGDLIFWATQ